MEFVPTLALASLVVSFVTFLRYLNGRDWVSAATQATAWAGGIGAVVLAAHTGFASGISIGDTVLADLDLWSQVFVALTVTSVGSTLLVEIPKALDNTMTSRKPPLFGPSDTPADQPAAPQAPVAPVPGPVVPAVAPQWPQGLPGRP